MTGEEWLRHTFDPGLRTSGPPYEQLRTELEALARSGVLSKDEASRARARLDEDERDRRTIVRDAHDRAVRAASAGDPEDRPEGVLTPVLALGEVDGITILLMRVELWRSRLILRLEARQNRRTDELDASFDIECKRWESRWVERRVEAEAEDVPVPEQPSVSRFGGLALSVADDVGTRYHSTARATGGPDPWRSEWRLEPGVPASARVLTVALEGGERAAGSLVLALPSRT